MACMALMCHFPVMAEGEGYAVQRNGVHFQTPEGRMRVEFVRPDIVRVRYTCEPAFLGNGTIVCTRKKKFLSGCNARVAGFLCARTALKYG